MNLRPALAILLALAVLTPSLPASDHVVALSDLQQQHATDESRRQSDIADLQRLFDAPEAQAALDPAGLEAEQIKQAVPLLDDETLAELAVKARNIENDVAGGIIGSLILLLILAIALVVVLSVTSD